MSVVRKGIEEREGESGERERERLRARMYHRQQSSFITIAEGKRKKEDTPNCHREPSFILRSPFRYTLVLRRTGVVGRSPGEIVGNREAHRKGTNRDLGARVCARMNVYGGAYSRIANSPSTRAVLYAAVLVDPPTSSSNGTHTDTHTQARPPRISCRANGGRPFVTAEGGISKAGRSRDQHTLAQENAVELTRVSQKRENHECVRV